MNKKNKIYVPTFNINSNIERYKINNLNNKYEVIKKVSKELKNLYNITIDIRKNPRGKNKFYIHNLSIKNK